MSRIVKPLGVYKLLEEGDSEKCLKICQFLSKSNTASKDFLALSFATLFL